MVLTSSNKCKATWDIINEITGYRHTKIDLHDLKVDHKQLTNPEEIAETFNNYFSFKENDVIKSKSQNKVGKQKQSITSIKMINDAFPPLYLKRSQLGKFPLL